MWKLSASARGGLHARVGRQSAEPPQMETALTCELVEENLPTFPQQLLEPHIWKLPTGLLPEQEAGRQGVGIHGNREEGKRGWELPSGAGSQPRGKQRLFSLSVTCWPGYQDPFVSGHGLCTCGIPGSVWIFMPDSAQLPVCPLLRPQASAVGVTSCFSLSFYSLSLGLPQAPPPFLSSGLVLHGGWSSFCQLAWNGRLPGPVQQSSLECVCGGIFRED